MTTRRKLTSTAFCITALFAGMLAFAAPAGAAVVSQRVVWQRHISGTPYVYVMEPNGSSRQLVAGHNPDFARTGRETSHFVYVNNSGVPKVADADNGSIVDTLQLGSGKAYTVTWGTGWGRAFWDTAPGSSVDGIVSGETGGGATWVSQNEENNPHYSHTRGEIFVDDVGTYGIQGIWALKPNGDKRFVAFNGTDPHVSKDGRFMAFVVNENGNNDIYTASAGDGSNLRRITGHSGSDINPAISPDGKEIAWSSNRDGDFDIYTLRLDGTAYPEGVKVRKLTNAGYADYHPSWQGM